MHLTKKYSKVLFISTALAGFGLGTSSHALESVKPSSDSEVVAFGGDPKNHENASPKTFSGNSMNSPSTSDTTTAQPKFSHHSGKAVKTHATADKITTYEAEPVKDTYSHHHHHGHNDTKHSGTMTTHPTIPSHGSIAPHTLHSHENNGTVDSTIRPTPKRDIYSEHDQPKTSPSTIAPDSVKTDSVEIYHTPSIVEDKNDEIKRKEFGVRDPSDSIRTSPNAIPEIKSPTKTADDLKDKAIKIERTVEKEIFTPKADTSPSSSVITPSTTK